MTTAVTPETRGTAARAAAERPRPADAFVAFGITGDLAKVMTFHSLYRLERRGLLSCPIVGVAVDDWSVDDLRDRARSSIAGTGEPIDEKIFERFASRLSYVSGDFADPETFERVAVAIGGARTPVFYLEIPPFLFGSVIKGLAGAGLTKAGARVVVEKPFGHDVTSARALNDDVHQYLDESQLYRIDHFLGKMGLDEILYLRFANADVRADLEPQPCRVGADHDGRELRRRGSRSLLRPGRRAARRRRQPPDAGRRRRRGRAAARGRSRHDQGLAVRPVPGDPGRRPGPLRARSARRLPGDRRRGRRLDDRDVSRPCGSRSTTGAGRACRSTSAPASTCRSPRPSCGSCSTNRPASAFASRRAAARSPTSWSSGSTRTTGVQLLVEAQHG